MKTANPPENYQEINRQSWNAKTAIHLESEFYDNDNFIKGNTSLKDIELPLLGDLNGKSVLHLQCHFGQDTISLSRLGANATGMDLSDKAIEAAEKLAIQTNSSARFLCCDLYDLPNHLDEQFDLVFTSYGTIGWLPDMDRWAAIVARYLKPGGRFVFAEFHPAVWMFDDDFTHLGYRYFNSGPIEETYTGTYANQSANIKQDYVSWNHGLAEVIQSLLSQGLVLDSLQEFDYSPYNCMRHMEEIAPEKFRIRHLGDKLPMVYALTAHKK